MSVETPGINRRIYRYFIIKLEISNHLNENITDSFQHLRYLITSQWRREHNNYKELNKEPLLLRSVGLLYLVT